MVDRTDLGHVNALYSEFNDLERAVQNLDGDGRISTMTISGPVADSSTIGTQDLAYPPAMTAAIRVALLARQAAIRTELDGLGLGGLPEPEPGPGEPGEPGEPSEPGEPGEPGEPSEPGEPPETRARGRSRAAPAPVRFGGAVSTPQPPPAPAQPRPAPAQPRPAAPPAPAQPRPAAPPPRGRPR